MAGRLNLITFVLQFFLTAFVIQHVRSRRRTAGDAGFYRGGLYGHVSRLPGVFTTGITRLTEAATRYSFNNTGMELLYLPLPLELRNRTKAFTDIFVDRFSRGIGGVILLIFLTSFLNLSVPQLSMAVFAYAFVWVFLALRAKNEYVVHRSQRAWPHAASISRACA